MTPREADLYRWFEAFTLAPQDEGENPFYLLALERGYVAHKKRTGEVVVTEDGWDWFATRAATIVANCGAGLHDMRPKKPGGEFLHCIWCGECAVRPCPECRAFYLGGTMEGGGDEPLSPTVDSPQRSPITHGYEKR